MKDNLMQWRILVKMLKKVMRHAYVRKVTENKLKIEN